MSGGPLVTQAPTTGGRVDSRQVAMGVTATTIKIGIYTATGYSSYAGKLGFSANTGDQVAYTKAIINYINQHGGILGRRIIPVFHDLDFSQTNADVENQAACAAWTQDDRVYAVASPVGTESNTLYDCLTKAGVISSITGESRDESFFERYPSTVYEAPDINLRRIFTTMADGLSAAGFFGVKPKIGVVYGDVPEEKAAVEQGLKPALARHGLSIADTFAIPINSSASAAYSSAVLQFASKGITHVLFSFLGSPLLFMVNAQSQHYHPKYGIHSRNSPAALLQGNAPSDQQSGTMGVGWQPYNDVDGAHDPGPPSARSSLCLRILQQAGQDTSVRLTALTGLWMCDSIFFIHDALAAAPNLSVAGFRAGAESLTRYEAASTFQSAFRPGRPHDAAKAYRLFAYKDSCKCYEYTSGLKPIP